MIIVAFAMSSSTAFAQDAGTSSTFALTPHIGVTSESAFVDGPIVFANGDVDFILIEPDAALLLGLELSYWFSPKLAGVLGLSYATADARYIENNDLRRDVGFDTLRIQPGVMATVVGGDKFALDVGGGLTLYRHSIDGLVWNDRRVDPSGFGLGLFGAAGIDVTLTSRLYFHSHLLLEVSRAAYGALEDDIAFADGEAGAEVDHDTRMGLVLAIGLGINL
jgi:hypothetical protein